MNSVWSKVWVVVLVAAMMGMGGVSCEESGSASGVSEEMSEETPESIARENNESAEEDLALSDKGVDDEGEKVWKQEARDYFDYQKNTRNRTFELSSEFARKFLTAAYAAGAEKVWVTGITEFELGGHKFNMADNMVVVLPTDPARRQAVFAVYNKELEAVEEPPLKDIGQKYIFITGD